MLTGVWLFCWDRECQSLVAFQAWAGYTSANVGVSLANYILCVDVSSLAVRSRIVFFSQLKGRLQNPDVKQNLWSLMFYTNLVALHHVLLQMRRSRTTPCKEAVCPQNHRRLYHLLRPHHETTQFRRLHRTRHHHTSHHRPPNHTSHHRPPNHTSHHRPPNHTSHHRPPNHTSHHRPPNHTSHHRPPNHTSHHRPPNHTSHHRPPNHTSPRRPPNHTSHRRPNKHTTHRRPPNQTSHPRLPSATSIATWPGNMKYPKMFKDEPLESGTKATKIFGCLQWSSWWIGVANLCWQHLEVGHSCCLIHRDTLCAASSWMHPVTDQAFSCCSWHVNVI